ncbi:MAG: hypothetical protein WCY62_01525 [Clostridia bacterium]
MEDNTNITDNNKEVIIPEDDNKKKAVTGKFKTFIKTNAFYLGLGILVIIAAIVLIFDRQYILKGDIEYADNVYVVGNNSISLCKYNSEPIVITSQLFENYKDQELGLEAHNGILMSNDEKQLLYVDNLHLVVNTDSSVSKLIGTLWLYDGTNNIKIAENASFYYVVSEDFTKIMYTTYKLNEEESDIISDLHYQDITASADTLLQENFDSGIFTLSGDGLTCIYLHDYLESQVENGESTYTLYQHKNGETIKIGRNVYDFDASAYTGTYTSNYPLICYDGSRIIYGVVNYVYMDDQLDVEETDEKKTVYPIFDIYLYENGENIIIAQSVAQILVSYDFDKVLYIDDVVGHLSKYEEIGYCGTYNSLDLDTLEKTFIMDNVFGFTQRSAIGFVEDEYLDAYYYFKEYNLNSNTASLYTVKNGNEILLDRNASVGADKELNLQFIYHADEYKDVYVFESYITKTSSLLYKYSVKSNGSFDQHLCEETNIINSMAVSDDGNNLVYIAAEKLVVINNENYKKTIERSGVSSFGITEGGKYLYYYKETALGSGALYYYNLKEGGECVKFLKDVNVVWNYKDDMIMFRMNTDYTTMTGDLYLTDFDEFEYISEDVYSQIITKLKVQ